MTYLRAMSAAATCGALALTTTVFATDANIRVIHASPDAPAVDVFVDGDKAFSDLAFTEASDYATLPAGTYGVDVAAAADSSIVVIDAKLTLDPNTEYSVVAVNTLSKIEPLVLIDDNTLSPDGARIRFVHASPNAPGVDITLTDGTVLFGDIEFKNVGDYIKVPAGSYDLEVRLAGTDTVVLPLSGIEVQANTVYTAFAMGLVGDEPALQAVITVDNQAPARVRVSHASPDAPAVDVFVDGTEAFSDIDFSEVTDYAELSAGTYNVQVAAAADSSIVVIDADLKLEPGIDYTVAATNLLAEIAPQVLIDDNSLEVDMARIRFAHLSPNAPEVDITLRDGTVLFGDFEYTEVSKDYLMVPGGSYDLQVRLAGTATVVLSLPGVEVENNSAYTAFAKGLVGDRPPLQAVLTLDAQRIPGDVDGDGAVNHDDLALLLGNWGTPGCDGAASCGADINGDGSVGPADLAQVLGNWTG